MNNIKYKIALEIINIILAVVICAGLISLLSAKKECRPDIKIVGDGVVIYWIE